MWDPVYGVDGPHPCRQWGVYIPNEYVAETISWFSANHGEFEVLFHPLHGRSDVCSVVICCDVMLCVYYLSIVILIIYE